MSSPVRKQAESEFDDLLGNLVDELAMTPPSQSAVTLIPEPPVARVESTNAMAAEAAAAAAAVSSPQKPDNTVVKVVGIIAGSLTAVAVAALLVLGGGFGDEPSEPAAVADDGMAERLAAAQSAGADAEQAFRDSLAATKAELEAEAKAEADAAAKAKAEAEAAAEAAAKPKKRRKRPKRPKPNKPKPPGDDFDLL